MAGVDVVISSCWYCVCDFDRWKIYL